MGTITQQLWTVKYHPARGFYNNSNILLTNITHHFLPNQQCAITYAFVINTFINELNGDIIQSQSLMRRTTLYHSADYFINYLTSR